jgi:flagellar motor switch protein FliG
MSYPQGAERIFMGVYSRYKRDPDGFRKLVELLETTPKVRRDKMVEVGMEEDPEYTERALGYLMNFQDVLDMDDNELAETLSRAPARMIAYSVCRADKAVKDRFLKCTKQKMMADVKDLIDSEVGPREIGAAQLKLVACAREAEKAGLVQTKRIPA